MNRSILAPGLAALMLVAVSNRLAAQTVVIEVENDARIPATDLALIEELVSRTYHAIGVGVVWEHGKVPLDDSRGLRVHLRLLSRTRADRKIAAERIGRDVLAQTNRPAGIVYVLCDRIVEASVKFSHDYTRMLALVVAHELGHVLLPAGTHADAGVMKGRANFWGKIGHEFTDAEGEAIRNGLAHQAR